MRHASNPADLVSRRAATFLALSLALALPFAVPSATHAQGDARMIGQITDVEGNPVARATITIISIERGERREFRTNDEGEYLQRGLRVERYVVRVEAEGYQPVEQEIKFNLGMNTVDVVLPPLQPEPPEGTDPDHLNALYSTGFDAYQAGDHATAVARMNELVDGLAEISGSEVEEMRLAAYQVIAASHMQLSDLDAAIEAYESMLSLEPENVDAHLGLGRAYAGQSDFETSLEHFRHAVELAPDDATTLYNAGVIMLQVEQTEAGIEALRRAIEVQPEFPLAHKQLGYAHIRAGDYAQAIERLRTYLEQEPEAADRADVEQMIAALEQQ